VSSCTFCLEAERHLQTFTVQQGCRPCCKATSKIQKPRQFLKETKVGIFWEVYSSRKIDCVLAAGDGEESSMEALSVALEIAATYEQLSESVAMIKSTVAADPAPGMQGDSAMSLTAHAEEQSALEKR
jgi:hypothetical protein